MSAAAFVQEKRRMTKGMRQVDRHEYAAIERHPIRLVTWATSDVNLGGMVRSAEAFLVDRLYALKPASRATAVGTDRWQPFVHGWEVAEAVDAARAEAFTVVALEQTNGSTPLDRTALPERMCLLVGNEGSGLPKSALAAADMAVEIRQFGFVGSLNVVTATGIALYEWTRQHRPDTHAEVTGIG